MAIDKKIDYVDKEKIDVNDINYSAALFEMTIFNVNIVVAIGKPNMEYIDNKITAFPKVSSIAARVNIEPKIGPIHGVQPNPKAKPIK